MLGFLNKRFLGVYLLYISLFCPFVVVSFRHMADIKLLDILTNLVSSC